MRVNFCSSSCNESYRRLPMIREKSASFSIANRACKVDGTGRIYWRDAALFDAAQLDTENTPGQNRPLRERYLFGGQTDLSGHIRGHGTDA